jgi:hypothetical protein
MTHFSFKTLGKDSSISWSLLRVKQIDKFNCKCRLSSSVVTTGEGSRAYKTAVFGPVPDIMDIPDPLVHRLAHSSTEPLFTWSLYPDTESDFLELIEIPYDPFMTSDIYIQPPTRFHSGSRERVFMTRSDWIIGEFVLQADPTTRILWLSGWMGTRNRISHSVRFGPSQILANLRFPLDGWVPFYDGVELNGGGANIDSIGITLLSGTKIVLNLQVPLQ